MHRATLPFALLALLALTGCVGDAYRLGAGANSPLSTEPDPLALLGPDVSIGARLDLAAIRATPTGADFDAIVARLVTTVDLEPADVAASIVERTDLAVLGLKPGTSDQSEAIVILRGQFTPADLDSRFTGDGPVVAAAHRGMPLRRGSESTLALLDQHVLLLGTERLVTTTIDHYLDRAPGRPGSPSVASGWDVEDTQFLLVVMPTPLIREELGRTPPLEAIARSFVHLALRVMPAARGEYLELRISSTSGEAAREFTTVVRNALDETARDPYAEASGLSVLLRALRVEIDDGEVRISGRATHEEVTRFARGWLDLL